MAGRILVVDDERDMLALLERIVSEKTEHRVVVETGGPAGLERFRQGPFDLVITDLKMPKMDGIKLLEELKKIDPDVAVVIMTAYATIETAVEAIRKGAYDYIMKPFRKERILLTIDKVMQWRDMLRENRELKDALGRRAFCSLVGSSPPMKEVISRIEQVAPTSATVLITGPSGTGKELVARAIHENSARKGKRMVTVNCTAIPESVMESELFGHVKGAFTGAWQDKKGLVEEAHQGTLFLDEVGDMSLPMQTKLLRLLEQGEYKPVGSVKTRKADIRFVAATNRDLAQAMAAREFREDLYFRLNVVRIQLPPLHETREDIPLLARHFLKKYSRLHDKEVRDVSPEALRALMVRPWPGNVRELENVVERGVVFSGSATLELGDLGLEGGGQVPCEELPEYLFRLPFKDAKEEVLRRFHRRYAEILLEETGGNVSKAAEKAGIQRQYLHQILKETGLSADAFKSRHG